MYIEKFEFVEIVFNNHRKSTIWSNKLGFIPELNIPIKIHWSLLKSTSYRTLSIIVKCDDCGTEHNRRIRDLYINKNYHLCKKCVNKGERNSQFGVKKTQLQIDSVKKFLKENGNPFTWENTKIKIKEKNPWLKIAEKNRGQKRSDDIKNKMSNSAINAFKNGNRKPTNGWSIIKIKQYKNIDYQSSYELKFLKYIDDLNKLDLIERGPRITYTSIDNKEHNYYIDFKIKNTNCVFEIKSTYVWNKNDNVNILKKLEAEKHFDYNLIMDNNFDNLKKIFEKYDNK
jgi:hypothetical protein